METLERLKEKLKLAQEIPEKKLSTKIAIYNLQEQIKSAELREKQK